MRKTYFKFNYRKEIKLLPQIQDFNGKKVICLNPSSKYPFSFGYIKAKMIIDNLESIKQFEADNRPQPTTKSNTTTKTSNNGKGKKTQSTAPETATAEKVAESINEDLPF